MQLTGVDPIQKGLSEFCWLTEADDLTDLYIQEGESGYHVSEELECGLNNPRQNPKTCQA